MPVKDNASFAKMMAPLRARYLQNLSASCGELTGLLHEFRQAEMTPPLIEQLTQLAHSMAGSGGIYGFPDISRKAAVLEDGLRDRALDRDTVLARLQALIMACEGLLDRPAKASVHDLMPSQEQSSDLPLVLVVDDNQDIRRLFINLLCDCATVAGARSAEEAFRLMAENRPDLILLDDQMPGGITGTAMLEELRFNPAFRDVPVIMVTAMKDAGIIDRALKSNVMDYIIKPFQPQQVAERIRDHLMRLRTKVLIVDDDNDVRTMLWSTFNAAGLHARMAASGAEALTLMKQDIPDAVLLDYMMPGMNGAALLQAMKEDSELAEIPVIFLTAKRDINDVTRVLKLGAIDYIVKPISPQAVLKRCLQLPKRAKASAATAPRS